MLDAMLIVFRCIAVLLEYRLIYQRSIRYAPELRGVLDPLVRNEHLGINLCQLATRNDPRAVPSAGRRENYGCKQQQYDEMLLHHYLNVAPNSFWNVDRSLLITLSTSLSVNVLSRS